MEEPVLRNRPGRLWRSGASNGVSATSGFVCKTVKLQASLAFASCSIAHIRGRDLAVKVKTGRGTAAPPTLGDALFNVGGGATRGPSRAQLR